MDCEDIMTDNESGSEIGSDEYSSDDYVDGYYSSEDEEDSKNTEHQHFKFMLRFSNKDIQDIEIWKEEIVPEFLEYLNVNGKKWTCQLENTLVEEDYETESSLIKDDKCIGMNECEGGYDLEGRSTFFCKSCNKDRYDFDYNDKMDMCYNCIEDRECIEVKNIIIKDNIKVKDVVKEEEPKSTIVDGDDGKKDLIDNIIEKGENMMMSDKAYFEEIIGDDVIINDKEIFDEEYEDEEYHEEEEEIKYRNNYHICAVINRKKRIRLSTYKRRMNRHDIFRGIEIQLVVPGLEDNLIDYSTKPESRVMGPWDQDSYPKEIYLGQDLFESNVTLLRWQEDLLKMLLAPAPTRKCLYIINPKGGAGKSWLVKYLLINFPKKVCYVPDGGTQQISTGLIKNGKNKSIFLYDQSRATKSKEAYQATYSIIENLKSGLITSSMYGSALKGMRDMLILPEVTVCVFSNFEPRWTYLSEDRWDCWEVKGKDKEEAELVRYVRKRKGKGKGKGTKGTKNKDSSGTICLID